MVSTQRTCKSARTCVGSAAAPKNQRCHCQSTNRMHQNSQQPAPRIEANEHRGMRMRPGHFRRPDGDSQRLSAPKQQPSDRRRNVCTWVNSQWRSKIGHLDLKWRAGNKACDRIAQIRGRFAQHLSYTKLAARWRLANTSHVDEISLSRCSASQPRTPAATDAISPRAAWFRSPVTAICVRRITTSVR